MGSIFGGVCVQSVFRGKLTGQSDDCVGAWLVQSFWSSGDGACRCKIGTIAFLCNLLREIFSFMIIPVVVKYFNGYAAIAPAAATSEDTTLPMLMKYTSGEVVMMAVLNGIICSAAVPVLIKLFNGIL